MSETPRLRSAFPATPQPRRTNASSQQQDASPPARFGSVSSKLPDVGSLQPSKPPAETPFIPFDIIDAPSQRMYVAGFYAALWFYRLYDFYNLTVDETESLWLFMKWVAFDGVFLFGLPALRIPWLEWSATVIMVLFMVHALVDGVLMFRIPIPLGSGLFALTKVLYDREIAISERRVKPADILNNYQLILGKQIVNVLPEGSAVLNPNPEPRCLDSSKSGLTLPLQLNQTSPVAIELIRFSLTDDATETIKFSNSQIKKLKKNAHRGQDPLELMTLELPVKTTGLYRLSRVQDESKLEVSKTGSEALVVACPSAEVSSKTVDRCRGDLSDLSIRVLGVPPLKIKYRRTINGKEATVSYQTFQPEDFASALVSQRETDQLSATTRALLDRSKFHEIEVPLNEALADGGQWIFTIEEVTDAIGNVVRYDRAEAGERYGSRKSNTEQGLVVHERPRAALKNLNMNKPLLVAAGESAALPIQYSSTGKGPIQDLEHVLEYRYTPNHGTDGPVIRRIVLKNPSDQLTVQDPGTYSLQSVRTKHCEGEVFEPSSCTLVNPPKPDLDVANESIYNKCAGSPIGLQANLFMSGTPPFVITYSRQRNGEPPQVFTETFNSMRTQIVFKPEREGEWRYKFLKISDKIYQDVTPSNLTNLDLGQKVKPSVSATFASASPQSALCQGEKVGYDVRLQGEGPWSLEYELVRRGNRQKSLETNIGADSYRITTPALEAGGDYSLSLTSVQDRNGCKEYLDQVRKFSVRHSKPQAAFGPIEGKRKVRSLDYKAASIPLRLSGESPWIVKYVRHHAGETQEYTVEVKSSNLNGFVQSNGPGRYEIIDVHDRTCSGSPSDKGDVAFEVESISRPTMKLPGAKQDGSQFGRSDVCEGDEDYQQIQFAGRPPFNAKYREHITPIHGAKTSVKERQINVLQDIAHVKMDTSQAGAHTYTFTDLGDSNYDTGADPQNTFQLKQNVNPRPSAAFADAGKVYSYCQGSEHSSAAARIPVKLTGTPPFVIELELKTQARLARPQTIQVPHITEHTHSLAIPPEYLKPGTSFLTLVSVRDAHSCERRYDATSTGQNAVTPRVQISVHDPPSVTPVEDRIDYCIGERIAYTLSGTAPFYIKYTFNNKASTATVQSGNIFRRLAESPGRFTITEVRDAASACPARISPSLQSGNEQAGLGYKEIHALPSVRLISQGREEKVDIHAGGSAEIKLEFGRAGTPPFEFVYTRSENRKKTGAGGKLLETRTATSSGLEYALSATEEGTYEVVAVKDKYCAFAKPGVEPPWGGPQRRLT